MPGHRDNDPPSGERWVCYCGEIAPWSWTFPHWDCQGGRPLTPDDRATQAT